MFATQSPRCGNPRGNGIIVLPFLQGKIQASTIAVAIQSRGPGNPGLPLSFRPNLGPKGRKKFFFETAPPLYLRVWVTAPPSPLSEGLDPPLHSVS